MAQSNDVYHSMEAQLINQINTGAIYSHFSSGGEWEERIIIFVKFQDIIRSLSYVSMACVNTSSPTERDVRATRNSSRRWL